MTFCQYTLEGKPLVPQEIKPYRWITLGEQKEFVDFLTGLQGLSKQLVSNGKLSWCASEFKKFKCAKDASHARVTTYIACGERGICPRCSMSYAHKRAGIMYQWIKDNLTKYLDFDLKMNQIVLTLPQKLHDMDRRLFVHMIKQFMEEFAIESYGYCVQDRHSNNPLSGRYLHAHILTLNMKEQGGRIVKGGYYFDVSAMRKVWKTIIEKCTDHDVEGSVNIHNEYASVIHEPKQVRHMLAYLYRYPIQDLFQVQIRDKPISYVQNLQIEKSRGSTNTLQFDLSKRIYEMVLEKKPRIVWCGWLTPAKRAKLIKLLERMIDMPIRWKNLIDVEKDLESRAKCCRDCGFQLESIPYDRGRYDGDNEPDFYSLQQ